MKQIFIFVCTFFLLSFCKATDLANDTTVKGKLVKVNQWNSRGIFLFDTYFAETKDDIIKQTGEAEFEQIKSHCGASAWPPEMNDMESPDSVADAKMNKLKMYQVASFQHKYNGNVFDREVILRVPYEENKDWDANAKWEGNIYFILKESDVEVIK
jgi:hypothetical protein